MGKYLKTFLVYYFELEKLIDREKKNNLVLFFLLAIIFLFLFLSGLSFVETLLFLAVFSLLVFFLPQKFILFVMKYYEWVMAAGRGKGEVNFLHLILLACLMMLAYLHRLLISFLTRFYPFSLFYRYTLLHADRSDVRRFIDEFEEYAKLKKYPVLVMSGEIGNPLSSFTLVSRKRRAGVGKEKFLQKFSDCMYKKYPDVYLSSKKRGFRLLVPEKYFN